MSKVGLLTQVAMIAVAVAIGYLYIKPTVTSIRETEDMIKVYQEEVDKVSGVNDMLSKKVSTIDAIPPGDVQALLRYLPDSVDDIAVMKDIVTILEQSGITNPEVSFKKDVTRPNTPPADGGKGELRDVIPYSFGARFQTTYPMLLATLSAIEVNNYLLQVTNLKITPDDEGVLDVTIELSAFALAPLPAPVAPVVQEVPDEVTL